MGKIEAETMKIIHKNLKNGEIKLKAENLDDLWYLSSIVEPQDLVSGKTVRKIKLGGEEERKVTAFKKEIFLEIRVENVEFHKYSNSLRISGTVVQGPEDVPKASYHTFNIEPGSIIKIVKKEWLRLHLDRIEAASVSPPKILVCIFDREEAHFYLLRRQGYEKVLELKGEVEKKFMKTASKDFYPQIIKALQEYNKRYKLDKIIIATPAFWKEYLMKELTDQELKEKIVTATVSSADKTAINEMMKRPELENVLKQDRIAKEEALVSQLLEQIGKDNLAEYGLKNVEEAVNAGAVEKLLLTDFFIQKARQESNYAQIEILLKLTESMKGIVFIISSENQPGISLDGIGGIGAILRYKIK